MLRFWACLFASALLWGQEAPGSARVLQLEARPRTVKAGDPVELRWATRDATRVCLEPPSEEVSPAGRKTLTPTGSTVYWLHAMNIRGGQSVPVAVTVEAEPNLVAPPGPEPASAPGFWIQFAALANQARAQEIQGRLGELANQAVCLSRVAAPARPGLTLHRIRMGPFPTRKAAQLRLRELRAGIQALGLRPVVMGE